MPIKISNSTPAPKQVGISWDMNFILCYLLPMMMEIPANLKCKYETYCFNTFSLLKGKVDEVNEDDESFKMGAFQNSKEAGALELIGLTMCDILRPIAIFMKREPFWGSEVYDNVADYQANKCMDKFMTSLLGVKKPADVETQVKSDPSLNYASAVGIKRSDTPASDQLKKIRAIEDKGVDLLSVLEKAFDEVEKEEQKQLTPTELLDSAKTVTIDLTHLKDEETAKEIVDVET